MESLSREFLSEIAREKKLSEKQTEAFIEIYSHDKKEQLWKIAEKLRIEPKTLRTRMSGIYSKFGFDTDDKNPRKRLELHNELLKRYQLWQENNPSETVNHDEIEIAQIRDKIREDIEHRCGKMQVLDMTQSIALSKIYTEVNILEQITARNRSSIDRLIDICSLEIWEKFDRLGLGKVTTERVSGLKAVEDHHKLMVWGKPGSGKTTFLKYLAIQCISEKFLENHLPIFVTLKEFADNSVSLNLEDFIQQHLTKQELSPTEITTLLKSGQAFILLDGLDEIRQDDSYQVVEQLKQFANQYRDNCFIITCRIASREYTFTDFREVEVADFNDQQIKTFVTNWFNLKNDPVKAKNLIDKLDDNQPIKELATNPLLLTLLCLVFGENFDFPASRAELYKEGIDVLLKKWDGKRNIQRDEVYKRLSLKRKEDLLAQIAEITFTQGNYFFKQEEVERYIADYISNLPDAKSDPDALLVDSADVLKSIEAQHGLLVERAKRIFSWEHPNLVLSNNTQVFLRDISHNGDE
jgi:predicted NACHT family NTPase